MPPHHLREFYEPSNEGKHFPNSSLTSLCRGNVTSITSGESRRSRLRNLEGGDSSVFQQRNLDHLVTCSSFFRPSR